MQVYLVDEAGYLSDEFPAQKNRKRPGEYLLPPDAILVEPNLNFPPISHESQSPRDVKYRELIDKFKDEDDTLILKRGEEDLSWYMEKKPEKTFEEAKAEKLSELNSKFSQVEKTAYIESSLGFTIDANETANRDLDGLITVMSDDETRYFCDYNNEMHPVSKADCETMRKEVIANCQNLYTQKWLMRDQIEKATTKEELEKIQIEFTQTSFAVKE